MTIKHLVIPGGGPSGIQALGVLQQLERDGYWKRENIETIYATSAGAIVSLLIALQFDWTAINDYIVLRPWHETYKVSASHIFDAYSKKGLFDQSVLNTFYKPFFDAKDLAISTTMQEFYAFSKIEMHFFSLELNSFQIVDISYKTFPDIPVIQAVHMSCAVPVIFAPVCFDKKCFVDGGIVTNYPIQFCLKQHPDMDEILGITNVYESATTEHNIVHNESTILDYLVHFIGKLVNRVGSIEKAEKIIQNECVCNTCLMNFSTLKETLYSSEKRKELLERGFKEAIEFLSKPPC